jgi:hypothetical protein
MAIDLGNDPGGTPPTAGEKLQIRSAIGVGTTDAPTFLAQTLTGQSLTGTQATSLVNLAATWNTTGNPSLIYGRVTNTNSGTTANLIDLGTFAGGSLFSVNKAGSLSYSGALVGATGSFCYIGGAARGAITAPANGVWLLSNSSGSTTAYLAADEATNTLSLRNGVNAQAFRVYNSTDATPATNFDRASFGFTSNVLRIGTENGGTYTTTRPIDFVTGGVVRMSIGAAGTVSVVGTLDVPTYSVAGVPFMSHIGSAISIGHSSLPLQMTGNRLAFNGTTSAFPAIKRNGTGIDIRLADDSAFAPVKGKLTTDTAYTGTVVAATGYITIYDATGTAYRVPCAV